MPFHGSPEGRNMVEKLTDCWCLGFVAQMLLHVVDRHGRTFVDSTDSSGKCLKIDQLVIVIEFCNVLMCTG